jgi:hypothetical protein
MSLTTHDRRKARMLFNRKVLSIVSLFLVLNFLVFFQATPSGPPTNAIIYLTPSSCTVSAPGQNVSVQVRIWQAYNFGGYAFTLRFNASLLQCISSSSCGAVFAPPSTRAVTVLNNSAGTIYVQSDAGDISGNGIVSLADLVLLANAYGSKSGDPKWNPKADVNGDGHVNLQDLVLLALNYGRLNSPNLAGYGMLLSVTFNATFAAPYLHYATCPLEISNATIFGTGNPPQVIPNTPIIGIYCSPFVPPERLNLALTEDELSYLFGQDIVISGSVTEDGYPIEDALVALEIKDPNGIIVALRTLPTSSFSFRYPVQIMNVTPCMSDGTPKNNFNAGTDIAYFSVAINNCGRASISNAVVWVNAYDSGNASIGAIYRPTSLAVGINRPIIIGIPLDYNATSGTATVYASVLTGYVDSGGVPLSFETQATFGVTSNVTGTPASMSQPPNGTYKTILKIHWGPSASGNYTIYAAINYMGIYATQNKQIQVTS